MQVISTMQSIYSDVKYKWTYPEFLNDGGKKTTKIFLPYKPENSTKVYIE